MKILKRVQAETDILPYQVSDMIKEIQDTVYNVSARYLKAKGWDLSDIADYFVVDVQEVEPGVIRAEIRGELSEDELFGLMKQLDRVIAVKFDEEAYFDAVTPGIAEAFIRTNVEACSGITTENSIHIEEGTQPAKVATASTEIKAYTFDESEDGWGKDIEEILSPVFARAEDLMYEVRNTVRGANTDCETTEDLADYIRNIAAEFEVAADEIGSL